MASERSQSPTRPHRLRRLRLIVRISTALLIGALVMALYAGDLFKSQELATVDARFSIRGDQPVPTNIAVVAIDDVTFSDLDEQWPFPRSLHAQVIDRLSRAGAKVIAYDVQFTEPTTAKEDNALINAIDRANNVVLTATEVASNGATDVLGGDELLKEIGAYVGNAQLPLSSGGIVRQVPYQVSNLETFSVVSSEVATGKQVSSSDFDDNLAWIDFIGPRGTLPTLSFSNVLKGDFPTSAVKGKIVVVGATAPSLQDAHPTSIDTSGNMSGAEIQANAIATVFSEIPLNSAPGWMTVLLIILFVAVVPLADIKLGPTKSALIGAGVAVLFTITVQLAFNSGEILPYVYPLTAIILGSIGTLATGLIFNTFERQRVHDLFSRFVPEEVVKEVLAHADEDLSLGGKLRTVTVLFSDIRGFTTYSETREPDEVIETLNRYLTIMCDVILSHGGTLVSFMGDGIMAVFGAPIDQDDQADRALAAAREMTGSALEEFNKSLTEFDVPEGFRIGVGLNTGPAMVGNVGSEKRLDYTAIGDVVNTASRLEGMTKGTPYMVFITEVTKVNLAKEQFDLLYVDELPVRGRKTGVKVWGLLDNTMPADPPSMVEPEGDKPQT